MYNMIFSMINIPPSTTASNKLDTVAVSQHHQARPRPLVQKKSLNIEQQKSNVFPYCQGTVKAIGKEPDLSVNKHVGDDLFTPPRTAFLKTSAYPNYLTYPEFDSHRSIEEACGMQEQDIPYISSKRMSNAMELPEEQVHGVVWSSNEVLDALKKPNDKTPGTSAILQPSESYRFQTPIDSFLSFVPATWFKKNYLREQLICFAQI